MRSFRGPRAQFRSDAVISHTPVISTGTWISAEVKLESASGVRVPTSAYLLLPRLKTKFGERAFSHVGPSAWNALPTHVRDVPNSDTFRKLLKLNF